MLLSRLTSSYSLLRSCPGCCSALFVGSSRSRVCHVCTWISSCSETRTGPSCVSWTLDFPRSASSPISKAADGLEQTARTHSNLSRISCHVLVLFFFRKISWFQIWCLLPCCSTNSSANALCTTPDVSSGMTRDFLPGIPTVTWTSSRVATGLSGTLNNCTTDLIPLETLDLEDLSPKIDRMKINVTANIADSIWVSHSE